MSKNTISTKEQLRQKSKRIRASLSEDTQIQASLAICQHIANWDIFQEANVILTYMPMQNEVDLTPLLARHSYKKWVIPRVLPDNKMAFHLYDPAKLVLHSYGMWEPAPDCQVIPPEEVDLALVPGLAFDSQGWRLGFGGGFYDRFLCEYKGVPMGIAYQSLFFDYVPYAAHDIPMRFVVTEDGVHKVERPID